MIGKWVGGPHDRMGLVRAGLPVDEAEPWADHGSRTRNATPDELRELLGDRLPRCPRADGS